jgi:hypothetical protein
VNWAHSILPPNKSGEKYSSTVIIDGCLGYRELYAQFQHTEGMGKEPWIIFRGIIRDCSYL